MKIFMYLPLFSTCGFGLVIGQYIEQQITESIVRNFPIEQYDDLIDELTYRYRSDNLISCDKFGEQGRIDQALIFSAGIGADSSVSRLIAEGANIDADNGEALRRATEFGHIVVVELLIKSGADINAGKGAALISAVRNGYIFITQYLVAKGADVHIDNDAPLMCASQNGHTGIITFLVMVCGVSTRTRNGAALRLADENHHLNAYELLLHYGSLGL